MRRVIAAVADEQSLRSGQWLLRVLARDGRFVIGEYRRQMKAIGYLGTLDRLFGDAGHDAELEHHHEHRQGSGSDSDLTRSERDNL